jgi:hypothetical protein
MQQFLPELAQNTVGIFAGAVLRIGAIVGKALPQISSRRSALAELIAAGI